MIKNIIFDFGDVFINLDKEVIFREIEKFGGQTKLTSEILLVNKRYEIGEISSKEFIAALASVYPKANAADITNIWNAMILDFPEHRLDFLENLAKKETYRLFLLSNTNALHIEKVIENMGKEMYDRFKRCFEQFYLSHEIHLRKPDANIFEFVLSQNGLNASETLFIDDTKENTDSAKQLGMHVWNLVVGTEDVVQLHSRL